MARTPKEHLDLEELVRQAGGPGFVATARLLERARTAHKNRQHHAAGAFIDAAAVALERATAGLRANLQALALVTDVRNPLASSSAPASSSVPNAGAPGDQVRSSSVPNRREQLRRDFHRELSTLELRESLAWPASRPEEDIVHGTGGTFRRSIHTGSPYTRDFGPGDKMRPLLAGVPQPTHGQVLEQLRKHAQAGKLTDEQLDEMTMLDHDNASFYVRCKLARRQEAATGRKPDDAENAILANMAATLTDGQRAALRAAEVEDNALEELELQAQPCENCGHRRDEHAGSVGACMVRDCDCADFDIPF